MTLFHVVGNSINTLFLTDPVNYLMSVLGVGIVIYAIVILFKR